MPAAFRPVGRVLMGGGALCWRACCCFEGGVAVCLPFLFFGGGFDVGLGLCDLFIYGKNKRDGHLSVSFFE